MSQKRIPSLVAALSAALLATTVGVAAACAAEPTPDAPEAPMTKTRVELQTSLGNVVLELDPTKAPRTVENFLAYVRAGFYDGTVFHRVIPGFMVQGGGFTPDMQQKQTQAPIVNEADNGLENDRGTIAMARTGDPHSATAQFFVNLVDNRPLNHTGKSMQGWGYTVFGEVVSGMDVVDRIARVPTGRSGPHSDVPREPVVIERARLLDGAGAAGGEG